ncbi:hypothetical protein CTEN210_18500 [Chaetoceros tenuissimus]|uniref:Uncharacterized protein n=1 Tax=Chaetoceros tenuissimus TaxID=426638 RepID=A0AAD3DG39_9STRA|nr:hypothetical protein CTEN210_18500 [Chaetoceros tenuissimus]
MYTQNFVKGSLLTVALLVSILTSRDDDHGSSTRQAKNTFLPLAYAAQEYGYQSGRTMQEKIDDHLEDAEYYEYDDTDIEALVNSNLSKDRSLRNRRLNENQIFQFSCSAHACLLANDIVQCVGYNYYGQIGQSTSDAFGTPVLLNFPSGVGTAKPVKVVTGYDHTCTLFDDKSVWCNGSNGYGQLGDTSSANSATPVQVKEGNAALADVTDIESGAYHNCAIKSSGAIYCWGFNTDGQLSLNGIMNGGTDATKVSKMALSMSSTCVVTLNLSTSVTCVGFGFSSTSTSTAIDLGSNAAKITAGSTHFCALLDVESKAKCWGTNHAGQRGIGSSDYNPLFDSAEYVLDSSSVSPLSGIADINAGYSSTCLVLSNGNAMCFGNNKYYQLGIGNGGNKVMSPTNVPIALVSGKTLVSVYVGEQTGHAVFNDDSVYSWGTNYGGTFGDGSSISSRNIIGSGSGSEVATEMNFRVPSPMSSGWRLLASNANTVSIAWDVSYIQFFPNTDCSGTALSGGNYLSSGIGGDSTTWGPQNAFLNNGLSWGGRADGSGDFYIGMTFSSNYEVGCVALDQRAETQKATNLIDSAYENINVSGSNYATAFNTAKTWFTNVSNHPALYLSGNIEPNPNKDYDGYFTDRFMLALVYYQNCSTGTTGCQNFLSSTWLVGSNDHCGWVGVTECTGISRISKDGSETYVESRVTRIVLTGKQLSGELPYFNISQLQYLYLFTNRGLYMPNFTLLQAGDNPLTGAFPQFQLANVQTLGFSQCSFSSVPDLTASCPNLQSIGMYHNKANLVLNQNMCDTFGAGSFGVATGYT